MAENTFSNKVHVKQLTKSEAKKVLTSLVTLRMPSVEIEYTDREPDASFYSIQELDKMVEYPLGIKTSEKGSGYLPGIRTLVFTLVDYEDNGDDVFF